MQKMFKAIFAIYAGELHFRNSLRVGFRIC